MEALAIYGTTIANSGNGNAGQITAIGASTHVDFDYATMVGGTLTASGGGVLRVADPNSNSILDGSGTNASVTLSLGTTLQVQDKGDWESVARNLVGLLRIETAQKKVASAVKLLVDELCRLSPEFVTMWRDPGLHCVRDEAVKPIRHPVWGLLTFEYSACLVDGRADLKLDVFNPATLADAQKISSIIGVPPVGKET